jgi:hypothetical protein
MSPLRPTSLLFLAMAVSALLACRVTSPNTPPTAATGAERPPLIDSPALAARCDPSRCEAFCASASCLFPDRRACVGLCQDRCGDAYFEPADHELVGCVEAQPGCEAAKACCAQHFTSHLCAE